MPAKESGTLILLSTDSGKLIEIPTYKCCHCGQMWHPRPGSGIRRGWCLKCNKPTCGAHQCDACVPFEQRADNIEAGRPVDFRRILV